MIVWFWIGVPSVTSPKFTMIPGSTIGGERLAEGSVTSAARPETDAANKNPADRRTMEVAGRR